MAKVTTDAAGKLEMYFRVARASVPKTLTFLHQNGADYSLAGKIFEMNFIDPDRGNTVLQLTSGSGLTIGANTITYAITDEESDLPKDFYYVELKETVSSRTWIFDKAHFISWEPVQVDDETELTVKLTGETINVTVTTGEPGTGEGLTEVDGGTI